VFLSSVDPDVLAFLRMASRCGMERILVVAWRDAAVHAGAGWLLLNTGASDVIRWTETADPVGQILARFERWESVDRLVASPLVEQNLVGASSAWMTTLRQVVEVARFTDASILVLGESGTGKELIARLIHSLDQRPRKKELVVLDCTTVVPELAGSEFFGHERGAFTGAEAARDGVFALADGGTLFLDEVGDLPLPLQAQILRAVQERTYKRVGGNRWLSTHCRLVSATHHPLDEQVEAGRFRADLYYRLAGVVCRVPPLRERPEDILVLFRHFLRSYTSGEDEPEIDPPVQQLLLGRRYPGNVRELEQLARRVAYRHVGDGPVTMGDIPEDERPRTPELEAPPLPEADLETLVRRALAAGYGLKDIGRMATDTAIRIAVGESGGNLQRAARRLGVTDRALQLRRAGRRTHPLH
jgi:transcriptional regulator with GAF, ATPase, and Fis domain